MIRARRRYAMRLPISLCPDGRKSAEGLLIEISQEGARISCLGDWSCHAGERVSLSLPDGQDMDATVRWTHDGLAGLDLTAPLHCNELSDLLAFNRDFTAPKAARPEQRYGT
ncbi:PilZ domain-containing protein [Alteraurantiacibacter aquimixticola]|nr:PilZ domain-containing protein [Alteraurantiacibacter aquimixticola]